jgi:hypothetical protein
VFNSIKGRPMSQNHDNIIVNVKAAVTWLAAFLGIGTFLNFVNLVVGMVSAAYVAVQLYYFIKYDVPVKRAKRQRLLDGEPGPRRVLETEPGDL